MFKNGKLEPHEISFIRAMGNSRMRPRRDLDAIIGAMVKRFEAGMDRRDAPLDAVAAVRAAKSNRARAR